MSRLFHLFSSRKRNLKLLRYWILVIFEGIPCEELEDEFVFVMDAKIEDMRCHGKEKVRWDENVCL